MALYIPKSFSPHFETFDMDENQVFSAVISGTQVTDYQIIIKKVSDDSQVYDSTKTTLTTNLYDGETLEHSITGGTIDNGYEYKWTIQVWNGATTVTSTELYFTAYTTPTLSLSVSSPITTQSYTFEPTYAQTESIDPKRFRAYLYDSSGNEIDDSDWIYSANIQYEFEGFISGDSYDVIFYVEDQNGLTANTGLQNFSVSYTAPDIVITPTITLDTDRGSIKTVWNDVVQYIGYMDETPTYEEDFLVTGDYGLEISDSKSLKYNFEITDNFTFQYRIKGGASYLSGNLVNISNIYIFGYNGSVFYYKNRYNTAYSPVMSFPTSTFLVIMTDENCYIRTITDFYELDPSFDNYDSMIGAIDLEFLI